MIGARQNLLFTATLLALAVVSLVHVFLFPLYEAGPNRPPTRTYGDFEQSLCAANIRRGPRHRRRPHCPQYGIVTIMQGGRLGNQMWEYASVWAVARRTGLEPYVPRCIRLKLEQVFEALSVPAFEGISQCPLDGAVFVKGLNEWNSTNQSIVLPKYTQIYLVLTWVQDIIQEFAVKKRLLDRSQQILHTAAPSAKIFVGVHVRRTDYIGYLRRKHSSKPANASFYLSAMHYFEARYGAGIAFIVVSDDPPWCRANLGGKENVHVTGRLRPNSPALDLAILASCNHSIFDYGTFGEWGAILAGGETVYYNLSGHSSAWIGQLLPSWRTI